MHWPQIALIALYSTELGIVLARNGEPKTGGMATYSFGTSLVGVSLIFALLIAGGFFA